MLAEVGRSLRENADPLRIMEECQKGVRLVGERYDQGPTISPA